MEVATLPISELWIIVARGCGVLALLWLLGRLVDQLPLSRKQQRTADRAAPALASAILGWYMLSSTTRLFGAEPVPLLIWASLLLGVTAVALWGPLRDLLAGVVVKVSSSVQLGDELSLEHARGRVERLGHRGIVLRTTEGETFVPYSLYTRAIVRRHTRARSASLYSFRVRPIAGVSQADLRRAIRESVLLCHWSAPAQEAQISALEQGALEIHVAAIDQDYATEIEAGVRRRLEVLERSHAPAPLQRLSQLPAANDQSPEPNTIERKNLGNPR